MQNTTENNSDWLFEITPKNKLFSLNLKEVWQYRDLLMLFVKRNIITAYKQTVLGPLWYLIQPLFTSVIFTLIFNNVANLQNEKWLDWEGEILIDEKGKLENQWVGRNYAYKPVIVEGDYGLGDMLKVKIFKTTTYDLRGKVVSAQRKS